MVLEALKTPQNDSYTYWGYDIAMREQIVKKTTACTFLPPRPLAMYLPCTHVCNDHDNRDL